MIGIIPIEIVILAEGLIFVWFCCKEDKDRSTWDRAIQAVAGAAFVGNVAMSLAGWR